MSPSGWLYATQTLTWTLFDPGNSAWFGEKSSWLTSGQKAEILASWYIFPRLALKLAHGRSRCVTGVREWWGEIGYQYSDEILPCFSGNKRDSLTAFDWIKRFSLPKVGKCLKTVGLSGICAVCRHKFFWKPGESYSKNGGIQHNKFRLFHPAIPCFQRYFRGAGWQNSENHRSRVPENQDTRKTRTGTVMMCTADFWPEQTLLARCRRRTGIFPMEGWRSPERQTGRKSGIHTARMAGRRQAPQEAERRGVPPRNTAMTAVEGSRVL